MVSTVAKKEIVENQRIAEELKEDKGFVFFFRKKKKNIIEFFAGTFGQEWKAQGYLQSPDNTKGGKQDVVQE